MSLNLEILTLTAKSAILIIPPFSIILIIPQPGENEDGGQWKNFAPLKKEDQNAYMGGMVRNLCLFKHTL